MHGSIGSHIAPNTRLSILLVVGTRWLQLQLIGFDTYMLDAVLPSKRSEGLSKSPNTRFFLYVTYVTFNVQRQLAPETVARWEVMPQVGPG